MLPTFAALSTFDRKCLGIVKSCDSSCGTVDSCSKLDRQILRIFKPRGCRTCLNGQSTELQMKCVSLQRQEKRKCSIRLCGSVLQKWDNYMIWSIINDKPWCKADGNFCNFAEEPASQVSSFFHGWSLKYQFCQHWPKTNMCFHCHAIPCCQCQKYTENNKSTVTALQ